MSTLFSINFRREAYREAVARARGRVIALGVWLAYFGVLAVVVGLFVLNAVALTNQVRQDERQIRRIRQLQGTTGNWKIADAELVQIGRFTKSPREWHDRLVRLSAILPPDVTLRTIAANPENVTGAADAEKLAITGQLRDVPGQDRMKGVMSLVATFQNDSLLSRHYKNVKLVSTKIGENVSGGAEFVIECR